MMTKQGQRKLARKYGFRSGGFDGEHHLFFKQTPGTEHYQNVRALPEDLINGNIHYLLTQGFTR